MNITLFGLIKRWMIKRYKQNQLAVFIQNCVLKILCVIHEWMVAQNERLE